MYCFLSSTFLDYWPLKALCYTCLDAHTHTHLCASVKGFHKKWQPAPQELYTLTTTHTILCEWWTKATADPTVVLLCWNTEYVSTGALIEKTLLLYKLGMSQSDLWDWDWSRPSHFLTDPDWLLEHKLKLILCCSPRAVNETRATNKTNSMTRQQDKMSAVWKYLQVENKSSPAGTRNVCDASILQGSTNRAAFNTTDLI